MGNLQLMLEWLTKGVVIHPGHLSLASWFSGCHACKQVTSLHVTNPNAMCGGGWMGGWVGARADSGDVSKWGN